MRIACINVPECYVVDGDLREGHGRGEGEVTFFLREGLVVLVDADGIVPYVCDLDVLE